MFHYSFVSSDNPDIVKFKLDCSFHLMVPSVQAIMRDYNRGRCDKVDTVVIFGSSYKLL